MRAVYNPIALADLDASYDLWSESVHGPDKVRSATGPGGGRAFAQGLVLSRSERAWHRPEFSKWWNSDQFEMSVARSFSHGANWPVGARPSFRSSRANGLCLSDLAELPKNPRAFSKRYLAMTFLSSSPLSPASQSGLYASTCECGSEQGGSLCSGDGRRRQSLGRCCDCRVVVATHHGLGFDPSLELLVQPLDRVRGPCAAPVSVRKPRGPTG